jgi:peroxiredoxin
MTPQIGRRLIGLTAVISVLALILAVGAGCGKKKTPPQDANKPPSGTGATTKGQPDELEMAMKGAGEVPIAIKKLVAETKDWSPASESSWGKIAPNFTLTDINGNVHTLNKYRGKNVVVLFWWTYNPTCKMEAARLKELRSSIPEDSLAILSISNETPAALKEAATAQGINFVVLSGGGEFEPPFNSLTALPTTFFIDTKGRFKMAATGVMTVDDAKTILSAK